MRTRWWLERLVTALGVLLPVTAVAVSPESTDAAAIMRAVEARPTGDKQVSRMQMTITDAAGRSRERVVRSRALKFAGGTRQLLFFESPADVRNTALLSVDYDAGGKDDDQWLYLPSLHKSTRISSSEKSGAFMGSDLTYADMTKKDPAQYTYSVVQQSAPVDGDDAWLIEARPNDREARETGYVKSHVWISKGKLLPLQTKAWVREGKKIKLVKASQIKQVAGIWIPHRMAVRTMRDKDVESTTVLQFTELKLNDASVTESDFTQRRLEQGL